MPKQENNALRIPLRDASLAALSHDLLQEALTQSSLPIPRSFGAVWFPFEQVHTRSSLLPPTITTAVCSPRQYAAVVYGSPPSSGRVPKGEGGGRLFAVPYVQLCVVDV